jgi:hypothetical protein
MKSEKFYKEAEGVAKDWGKTLKEIDVIKDKVNNGQPISLKDSMYVAWAEYKCQASDYSYFKERAKDLGLTNKKLKCEVWLGLFKGFLLFRDDEVKHAKIEYHKNELKHLGCKGIDKVV